MVHRLRSRLLLSMAAGASVLVLAASPKQAAAVATITNNEANAIRAASAAAPYWTPGRMRSAKPMTLPNAPGLGSIVQTPAQASAFSSMASSVSSEPGIPVQPGSQAMPDVLLHQAMPLMSASNAVAPAAANASRQEFTNSRVVPMNVLKGMYPWQATGKLFFRTDTGQDSVCSGAIVQHRVIATAGHCLYNPVTRKFFSNFMFVPGHDNGSSPCGGYSWEYAAVTSSWQNGNGVLPNRADFGVLVAANKPCRGKGRIGASLGWLGWRTNAVLNKHVTILGYPCNLDSCQVLQQTNTLVNRSRGPAVEAGSYHEGGASGGPWVLDWGIPSSGQPANSLQIVGITSYQPGNRNQDYLGSSILNNEWVQIWNLACARAGACR
ncbi:trypsin-like serine peptidase [Geminicoccus flavidas]|uniref:trypsin-like serine peptidase n=1 Tax=Geminicoccus flavidas TaxID=2506407 RepID=UPI00135C125A|nr:trypsin-like serine protease [Geminicoccus flavidas]